ncbi:hypothetical protein ABW20_dc0107439 [Dactylellina cionopaga]|nr:hypothetical protein ABW20_dc0107439 [Dactylellina cionopaga]
MPIDESKKLKKHSDYRVGWICTLPKEQTAATAMLDEEHPSLPKPPNDPNMYTLGLVLNHNVAITCLPKGKGGSVSASAVATRMANTFPNIKFMLMVGIGSGIPNGSKVRLGDVVVSTPVGPYPGVVQWAISKSTDEQTFERTGALNNPPTLLLTALSKLEVDHEMKGTKIPEYLEQMGTRYPRLKAKYLNINHLQDLLFRTSYKHVVQGRDLDEDEEEEEGEEEEESTCQHCDRKMIVKRKPQDMRVHYGLIASGNQTIHDPFLRNNLNQFLGGNAFCVETEAAGVMNDLPCIVIRGICDYADSHKNDYWQEYAAAVAAAFAKEVLGCVQPGEVEKEPAVKELLEES